MCEKHTANSLDTNAKLGINLPGISDGKSSRSLFDFLQRTSVNL
jgi:hypothetical protein